MKTHYIFTVTLLGMLLVACSDGNKIESDERMEEIKQLVDDASDLMDEVGKREAIAQYRQEGSPWFYGETYIFVFNGSGQVLLESAKPALEGKQVSKNAQDGKGNLPILEMLLEFEKPKIKSAWFRSSWPKPHDSQFYDKVVYVVKKQLKDSNPRGLFIGAGYYN